MVISWVFCQQPRYVKWLFVFKDRGFSFILNAYLLTAEIWHVHSEIISLTDSHWYHSTPSYAEEFSSGHANTTSTPCFVHWCRRVNGFPVCSTVNRQLLIAWPSGLALLVPWKNYNQTSRAVVGNHNGRRKIVSWLPANRKSRMLPKPTCSGSFCGRQEAQ